AGACAAGPGQALRSTDDVPSGSIDAIERIRRVDANTLVYRFTIEDPTTWDRVWTVEYPRKATTDHLYEYACAEEPAEEDSFTASQVSPALRARAASRRYPRLAAVHR